MAVRDYVYVTKLNKEKQAEVFERTGEGYFYSHNGASSCVFHNGEAIHYIGYVEFAPNKSRGNHYHLKKNEKMCVIKGKVKAQFVIPESDEEIYDMVLKTGDIVYVKAGCAHSYLSEEGAAVVEYSCESFEKSDTYKYSFKWREELF